MPFIALASSLLHSRGAAECIYHLRYFKTTPCIHDSNEFGTCLRYGRHCAFCHGDDDFRAPIFDVPSPAMAPLLTYGMSPVAEPIWGDARAMVQRDEDRGRRSPEPTSRVSSPEPMSRVASPVPSSRVSSPVPPSMVSGAEWNDESIVIEALINSPIADENNRLFASIGEDRVRVGGRKRRRHNSHVIADEDEDEEAAVTRIVLAGNRDEEDGRKKGPEDMPLTDAKEEGRRDESFGLWEQVRLPRRARLVRFRVRIDNGDTLTKIGRMGGGRGWLYLSAFGTWTGASFARSFFKSYACLQ